MFPLMSKVAVSALLSAFTLINPTTPKALSFDASAYVTSSNQIRLAVQKSTDQSVLVILRNTDNQVLFRQSISKNEATYAVKLNVDELADGQYEIEIKSNEGSIHKQIKLTTSPIQMSTRLIAMK